MREVIQCETLTGFEDLCQNIYLFNFKSVKTHLYIISQVHVRGL